MSKENTQNTQNNSGAKAMKLATSFGKYVGQTVVSIGVMTISGILVNKAMSISTR